MLIALVPILMLIIGILMYVIPGSAERKEIGRWLGLAGAIGIAIAYAAHMVKLG